MDNITDITESFGTVYHPKSALIVYESTDQTADVYVEHFDMDRDGNLINAHPLTVREADHLAKSLQTAETEKKSFLKPQGIMANNILQIDPSDNGMVIWFTKAKERDMFFVESLGIPSGKANVPPMVWIADRNRLTVYALKTGSRPTGNTPLYYAPFFNIYQEGSVCMGTVNIEIKKSASLNEFTDAWENYFFNSYFSHLMNSHNPINGNLVSLWKKLIGTPKIFPNETLKKTSLTLKNVLR